MLPVSERHKAEFGTCPHWRTRLDRNVPYCIDCNTRVCHGTCESRCWDRETHTPWHTTTRDKVIGLIWSIIWTGITVVTLAATFVVFLVHSL